DYEFPRAGQSEAAAKTSFVKRFDPWNMFIGTGVYVDDVAAEFIAAFSRFAAVFAALLLPILLISAAINRSVHRSMDGLIASMRRIAANDLTAAVEGADRRDEFGTIARALGTFRDAAHQRESLERERADAVVVRDRRAAALDALIAAFEHTADHSLTGLSTASADLGDAAQNMAALVQQTGGQAEASTISANETAANVQTVASAAEELTRSISEIGRQMERSTDVVERAVGSAERAGGVVSHLADTARRIGDVVSLINSVAGQTNLLALNATIEAARAGEAGKGFAVVASEVKALAGQTGRATEEIDRQVQAIQSATADAVTAINQVGGVIGELRQISAAIAAAVEEQGAATREISRSVQEAARGARDVTNNVADIAGAAAGAGGTVDIVRVVADALSRQSMDLRDRIGGFLAGVKAA
ncbi:methyl-accepting chemotaxis protein, partial [bacterium]|nr:methyl-accepting chemotaxis protein [bacterium]